jgi:uncharacterized protein (DUF934 family)
MSLRDLTGEIADIYRRDDNATIADAPSLVPLAALEAALTQRGNQPIGVEIANTTRLEALLPHLASLSLIAIGFPGFGDGRGYSIAKQLRLAGFAGRLRAVGPLIADQFAYALACGFDEVELPEAVASRQPVSQWLVAVKAISATYQPGYAAPGSSILERRRAAREGAAI